MLWIFGVIILIVIIVALNIMFSPRKKSKINGNETEEERVYRLVEEKKTKARELKLPEILIDLYLTHIVNYPEWINRDDRRGWVPSEVKFVEEIINDSSRKQIKTGIFQNTYVFKFESRTITLPNGSPETNGTLELWLKDKKVLALDMICEHNKFGSIWTPYGLRTFIDGAWINDFQELRKHTIELSKKREEKKWNTPQKIKDLKDNFNIE